MEKKYKNLFNDTIIFGIGGFGSKIILFLLLPLYTNVLSTEEYGVADLVFTIGQLILPFISLSIYNGLIRYALSKNNSKENALLCTFCVFCIGSLLCFGTIPLLMLYEPIKDYVFYLIAYTIVSFASTNTLTYLKVKDMNKAYAFMSILQAIILVTCNILFLLVFNMHIEGYLLSTLISMGTIAVISFFKSRMHIDLISSKFDKVLFKEMILYSLPFILNDISWWVIHSCDKMMIEWYLTSSALGLYTAAAKIPSLINVFSSLFSQAWGLSSIKEYDNNIESDFYSKVFKYFTTFMFGVCIFAIFIIKPFMKIYIGAEFFESWKYVPLLLISATFASISAFLGSLYGAMKKSVAIMITTVIAAIINIILNFVFIRTLGIWGAIIGTVMSYIIISVIRMIDVERKIKIDYGLHKFVLLSFLVITQAVLVGLDLIGYLVSTCSLMIYIVLTWKDYRIIIKTLLKNTKNKGE